MNPVTFLLIWMSDKRTIILLYLPGNKTKAKELNRYSVRNNTMLPCCQRKVNRDWLELIGPKIVKGALFLRVNIRIPYKNPLLYHFSISCKQPNINHRMTLQNLFIWNVIHQRITVYDKWFLMFAIAYKHCFIFNNVKQCCIFRANFCSSRIRNAFDKI